MQTSTERRVQRGMLLLMMALVAVSAPAVVSAQDDEAADYSKKGADTCFQCHDDQTVLGIFRSKHAVPTDPNSPYGHG
ncbi:MAG: hypothetical protein WBM80_02960, partial [Woeseiaceae bacterium]